MSKFVMIAGTKGGIGKTLIATFLADIASEHGFRPVLFDCDNENHSLSNACGGVPEFELADIDPESAEETDYPLDSAVNRIAELESVKERKKEYFYLLDMKAGTSGSTIRWLEAFPFEYMRQLAVEVYLAGCVTADIDSCLTWGKWLREYAPLAQTGALRFLLVRNHLAGDRFDFYDDKLRPLQESRELRSIVIDFPELSGRYLKLIKDYRTSFGQVARKRTTIASFGFMDLHRIRLSFEKIKTGFDGLFNPGPGKEVAHGRKQEN